MYTISKQACKAEAAGVMGAHLKSGTSFNDALVIFNNAFEKQRHREGPRGKIDMRGWWRRALKDVWQERAFTPKRVIARVAMTYSLEYRRRCSK